jgi:hypothetical protein
MEEKEDEREKAESAWGDGRALDEDKQATSDLESEDDEEDRNVVARGPVLSHLFGYRLQATEE